MYVRKEGFVTLGRQRRSRQAVVYWRCARRAKERKELSPEGTTELIMHPVFFFPPVQYIGDDLETRSFSPVQTTSDDLEPIDQLIDPSDLPAATDKEPNVRTKRYLGEH